MSVKPALTEDDVREVLKLHKAGMRQSEIAKHFGVRQSVIYGIINGVSWRHVTGLSNPALEAKREERRKRREQKEWERQQRLEAEQRERDRQLTDEEMADEMPMGVDWDLPAEEVLTITSDNIGLLDALPDQSQTEVKLSEAPSEAIAAKLRRVLKPDGVVIIGKQRLPLVSLSEPQAADLLKQVKQAFRTRTKRY